MLTESALLSIAGGAAGVLLAYAAIPPLMALAGPGVPNLGPVEVDDRVLLFVCGVVMLATLLFGFGPALQTIRFDLVAALNEGSRGSIGAAPKRSCAACSW